MASGYCRTFTKRGSTLVFAVTIAWRMVYDNVAFYVGARLARPVLDYPSL